MRQACTLKFPSEFEKLLVIRPIIFIGSLAFLVVGCGQKEYGTADGRADELAIEKDVKSAANLVQKRSNRVPEIARAMHGRTSTAVDVAFIEAATQGVSPLESTAKAAQAKKAAADRGVVPTIPVAVAADAESDSTGGYDLILGKIVYRTMCLVCHDCGAAGAPKLGDKAGWEQRIVRGMDILVEQTIKGHRDPDGYMSFMPGIITLSNDDIAAAVAYMVNQSQGISAEAQASESCCFPCQNLVACDPKQGRKALGFIIIWRLMGR